MYIFWNDVGLLAMILYQPFWDFFNLLFTNKNVHRVLLLKCFNVTLNLAYLVDFI